MTARLAARRAGLFALSLALLGVRPAVAENVIHWGWHNRPPIFIAEGADEGHGAGDRIRRLIAANLPNYRHQEVKAPIARVLREIRNGAPWCAAGLVRTPERSAYAVASLPVMLLPEIRLVIRREDRSKFGADEPLSLEALLSNKSLRGFIERDRSYGPAVDDMLARLPREASFSAPPNGVRMLLTGRFDYLLERDATVRYYAEQQGEPQRLISLALRETPEELVLRVLCPRNAWGRDVINEVDQALRKIRTTPEYRLLVEQSFSPEAAAALRQQYGARFLDVE